MAAPARKSQLFSTGTVKEIHFGSSGTTVATFQYKCSKEVHFGSSGSEVATFITSVEKEVHTAAHLPA